MAQPKLPILRPTFRTIDGKTMADSYNRGQATQPDYEWPGRRRFYQKPPPAPTP